MQNQKARKLFSVSLRASSMSVFMFHVNFRGESIFFFDQKLIAISAVSVWFVNVYRARKLPYFFRFEKQSKSV